jgi:cell division GTPase FtsZ
MKKLRKEMREMIVFSLIERRKCRNIYERKLRIGDTAGKVLMAGIKPKDIKEATSEEIEEMEKIISTWKISEKIEKHREANH